ncbi:MAG: PAS domain-containing protein [Verrucomicrobiae bacterium]|nr:PAS domain-containing protein [Verrucomicrobiae bacterium]
MPFRQIQILASAIPYTVGILDPSGTIEYVNSAVVEQYGFEPEELIGKSARECYEINPDDAGRVEEMGYRLADIRPFEMRLTGQGRDGGAFPVGVAFIPFQSSQTSSHRYICLQRKLDNPGDEVLAHPEFREIYAGLLRVVCNLG